MSITIGSSLAGIRAVNELGKVSSELQKTFTRLSSGARINSAADDASGLAVASKLELSSRVFSQAIRNVNDGVSLLSIADSALESLGNIVVRQRELATQAASGSLSLTQRQALNQEANALVEEYNRIAGSTDFNNIALFTSEFTSLQIQEGFGSENAVSYGVGAEGLRSVGDGTYNITTSSFSGNGVSSVDRTDFDGDGDLDLILGNSAFNRVAFLENDGSGSFTEIGTISENLTSVEVRDVNNDGQDDLIFADTNANQVKIRLSQGGTSFAAATTYAGTGLTGITLGDFDNDGFTDIAAGVSAGSASILLGNGNGTFSGSPSVSLAGTPLSLATGDINGDGADDLIAATSSGTEIHLSNGDGTFSAGQTIPGGGSATYNVADLNNDGYSDLVITNSATATGLYLGTGPGTLSTTPLALDSNLAVSGTAELVDLTGDGIQDIVLSKSGTRRVSLYIGDGEGGFGKPLEDDFSTSNIDSFSVGDFNGDGVPDIAGAAAPITSTLTVGLGEETKVATQARLNLNTADAASAELTALEAQQNLISAARGEIGAAQSRSASALSTLAIARQGTIDAESRITSADVAEEAANLVRQQVRQQAVAAVLSQANQQYEIALSLIDS